MTRAVPSALQTHLDQAGTTTCRLLKIYKRAISPPLLVGLCSLDVDIEYDDGSEDGPLTYVATSGFDPQAIAADLDLSVSNTEGYALLSQSVDGITAERVLAGELDDAEWVCYLVNFRDLTQGHVVLAAGDLGEIRMHDGIVWIPELLDYVVRLKQPIGGVDSRTCRAIYGSPAASQTGCGVDISGLWVSGTVQSVGLETDRTFTGDFVPTLPDINYPARLQFLTGANAGREFAVEQVDGLVVSLFETTIYPMEAGDEYRLRQDCAKRYLEDCIDINANGPNFKGEPYIPVGDAAQGQTPGAQLPGGGGSKFAPSED